MRIENKQNRGYLYDESKLIYEGQSSRVYDAIDETFNRKVCLKIISYKDESPLAIANIKKETIGLAIAGTSTTHVPMLFDFWQDDPKKLFYIVMQHIPGETLKKRMESADRRTFINWMISLCDTLGKVHQSHIYHKDIKPDNIIITPSNDVYLIDFNISIGKSNLTEGTTSYKAPEMHHQGITSARNQSDIFSVGVMLYEFFVGTIPVEGNTYGNGMFSRNKKEWSYFKSPQSLKPDMPPILSNIIEKCMKKDPESRYRQASELKRELVSAAKEIRKWTN